MNKMPPIEKIHEAYSAIADHRIIIDNDTANWTELNSKHKANYTKAVSEIMDGLKADGIDCDAITKEVNEVYKQIALLNIACKRSSLKPPKSNPKKGDIK